MSERPYQHFNLAQWLEYQQALHGQVIELGLERVREVASRMNLTPHCPVITVAGTNGKGSTCAFLNAMLSMAGYRVGVYTSPHLVRYNERIMVADQLVSDEELCQQFARIESHRGEITLTPFEFGTLAAVALFIQHQVDVMVLEVGLGGRLDAVNIFDANVAVITSIGIDHVAYLGDTREAIGREKAGIFRSQIPAICADPDPPQSILDYALTLNTPLSLWGRDFSLLHDERGLKFTGANVVLNELPHPALKGDYQLRNAAAAIMALLILRQRLPFELSAIEHGLKNVFIPGRFQTVVRHCPVILDVAHNPHGAHELKVNLQKTAITGRTFMLFGMLNDKDIQGVISALKDEVSEWHVASVPDVRGASGDTLASLISSQGGVVIQHDSFIEGIKDLLKKAHTTDRIVVTGSFVTVGLVADYLSQLG